jgi:hypothetical protein
MNSSSYKAQLCGKLYDINIRVCYGKFIFSLTCSLMKQDGKNFLLLLFEEFLKLGA